MSIFGIPLSNGILPDTLSENQIIKTQYSSLTGMMIRCKVESDVCKISNGHGIGKNLISADRLSIINSNIDLIASCNTLLIDGGRVKGDIECINLYYRTRYNPEFKIKCKFALVVYLGNDDIVDLRNIIAPKVKFHNKTNHLVTVYFHEETIVRPIWHD